jgi:hypothetical protein
MARRALLVGVNSYDNFSPLTGCVLDASKMKEALARNYDGSPNYDCRLLTTDTERVTRAYLREVWGQLFDNFADDILFYFSGHGTPTATGGFVCTQDATTHEPGLPMDEILLLANRSRAREVLLILDCCFAGSLGNPPNLRGPAGSENQAQLREGVTVLAASRPSEVSREETGGHGIFTWLVLNALEGGAADVRGRVSTAAIYAYVEQVLGPWDQRPMYKSHADRLSPVRLCKPAVTDALLRELADYFPTVVSRYQLDPTYEASSPSAVPEHVTIYDKLTQYRDARLLRTVGGNHLYYTVMASGAVELTELGQLYWLLAKESRL